MTLNFHLVQVKRLKELYVITLHAKFCNSVPDFSKLTRSHNHLLNATENTLQIILQHKFKLNFVMFFSKTLLG